jgi:hypothetical protein
MSPQSSRRHLALAVLTIAVFGAAIGFACDDNSGDSLTPGGYGAAGNGNPIGSLGGEDATALTPAQVAEAMYRALESDLVKACGGPCHGTGTAPGNPPLWLAPPDTYVSVKTFPGAITPDPSQSRILNHGPHAGPALTSGTYKPLGDRVYAWLQQEAIVLSLKELPSTDPFTVTIGANSIDISKGVTETDGGAPLTGAKITFTAAKSGTILELTKLTIVAPASTGVRIAHPVFVIIPAMGPKVNDPVDSLSNVDVTVAAGQSAPLGTGDLFLFKWDDTNKLKIAFNTLEAATPMADAGGMTGGCKSPTTFTSSAVPEIMTDGCLGCHAGSNGAATSALDLTQVGKDNTMACAQALNKVNLTNKPQSAIIQAPAGTLTHQGGKVQDTQNFTNAMLGWINNE